MKKYYIEIDGRQSEPLTFAELKAKSISRKTLVWFEGQDNWMAADSIPELEPLFKSVPPPLTKTVPPPIQTAPAYVETPEHTPFFAKPLNKILVGGFTLIVFVLLVVSFNDSSQAEAENQTQQNTELLQQQQLALDEQNAKIAEQERIERERAEKEAEEARQKRITELNNLLTIETQNLEVAKRQLNDATAFQLLRSNRQRNRDINAAEENVRIVQGNIAILEKELQKLN